MGRPDGQTDGQTLAKIISPFYTIDNKKTRNNPYMYKHFICLLDVASEDISIVVNAKLVNAKFSFCKESNDTNNPN